MDFNRFVYGCDYNPEQWPEEIWPEDVRLMQEAGVNLVSLGIFAWARLEPRPGVYTFDWLDRAMDLLHAGGISVNLATPTASPPPWLVRLHPEMLPVLKDGTVLWHGSRRHYCPHSAAYREQAARLVERLAGHFGGHPALKLWHVDNEYACYPGECFCSASAAAFRKWLASRYGSLEALNGAWGTTFWGQIYGDWEEIEPPRPAPASINPGHRLDWARFCSDSWMACFDEQKAVLRRHTPQIPVTTNFMSFFKPLNYWDFAAREDVVSNDSYPDPSDPEWMVGTGMACDLIRSIGRRRPWLLMEQAPSQVNWRPRNVPKPPGVMRLGSYQAAARGADGVMFFQWRASRAGAEKFHSGMVPHGGTETRVWGEVARLGGELPRLNALLGSRVRAEAAILFDWENWWALELDDRPSAAVRMLPQLAAFYAGLFRRGQTIDFAHPADDLSAYRLVIAPTLYLVGDRAAENVVRYVEGGGTLLMSFFSGMVDANDCIRLGGYPAPFRKMLGLWIEEFAPYAEGQANTLRTEDGRQFACALWSDVIRLEGAEALAAYVSGWYAGSPAVTRHAFGQGTAFYAGTAPDRAGMDWLLEAACAQAGLPLSPSVADGVEVVCRTDGTRDWLFVLNYRDEDVRVPLERPGIDLLTGAAARESLELAGRGAAVLALDPRPARGSGRGRPKARTGR